jgi:fructokinase/2-dehydro-3-deoxygluconokinase
MNQPPVLILGDACVDLLVRLPEKSGNSNQHQAPALHGGGTGANTAVALARLALPTAFMGTVGDDGFGRYAVQTLAAEGIDTSRIRVHREAFTVQALALIDAQGERTLFGWPRRGGAHIYIEPEWITPELIAPLAWLHTTGMCLVESPSREAVLRALSLAQTAGVPVSFDLNLRLGFEDRRLPDHFLETIRQAMACSNYVFGSGLDEIIHLTPDLSYEAGAQLLAGGERTLIVRLGAAGVLAVSAQGEMLRVPAFTVEVVDTVGAGDVFNAGFIAARLVGLPLAEAVRWGNATAALKITRSGARSSPKRAEVEAFLQLQG